MLKKKTPADILRRCISIFEERGKTHGNYDANMACIATLWNITQTHNHRSNGADVAFNLFLVKIGRMQGGTFNMDDYFDAITYLAISAALKHEKETQDIINHKPSDTE